MDAKVKKQLKKKLEVEKKKLTKELSSFAKKDPKRKGNWLTKLPFLGNDRSHKDESAERIEAYETLLPIEHTLETRLKKVNRALEKIDNKDYGKCEKCGGDIKVKRLEIVPEARLCLKCGRGNSKK